MELQDGSGFEVLLPPSESGHTPTSPSIRPPSQLVGAPVVQHGSTRSPRLPPAASSSTAQQPGLSASALPHSFPFGGNPLSRFHTLLSRGLFVDPEARNATLEDILLYVPHTIITQLVQSIDLGTETELDRFALATTKEMQQFTFTLDSGSEIHILTLAAAMQLFTAPQVSNLRVTGVSGSSTKADLMGHLVIAVEDPLTGMKYHIDLGVGHGMHSCPMNLLSVSLLIKAGAIVHFEHDNCYFQPSASTSRIPFTQAQGMFQLEGEKSNLIPEVERVRHSYMVNGYCFATSGNLQLWHRRMRHMSKESLLTIFKHGLVDGFKLTGRMSTTCDCDTCRQAKIKRWATPREHAFEEISTFIGHTVHSDLKSLPYASFQGFKYVINFVDRYSRLGFCYFLRSKTEVTATLHRYLTDMKRLGVKVHNLYTDRGSEYFEQEGDSKLNRGRVVHEFGALCIANGIVHHLQPTEMQEKIAEVWFRDHFSAVDSMLWDARLSPAFWPEAVEYSQYCFNHTPSVYLGGQVSPWQLLTGERSRWDKFRVFGCDVFEHIPNNDFAKVPGVPKGRKLIFVGFQEGRGGFKVFDPESRQFHCTGNCYFYENFTSRVDALRHHDQRRALLKKGLEQPVIMDDFADSNSAAVRNLFLDPDAPLPAATAEPLREVRGAASTPLVVRGQAPTRSSAESSTDEAHPSSSSNSYGPLSNRSVDAERARQLLQREVMLRPLRLLAIGKENEFTTEDRAFLKYIENMDSPIAYQSPCPKRSDTSAGRRYVRYMRAHTIREALDLGATRDDLIWDYRRAWISFPKHEPNLTGHVFSALELAAEHGYTHILEDLGMYFRASGESDIILAHAFNARNTSSFNRVLETVFEPEVIIKQFEDRESTLRFAEFSAAKVLNSSTIKIDFKLAPEPTRFAEVQPEVCAEHDRWREAMDDEIASMIRFGVYRRLPKSAAGTRQILGCRWVYKRKVNKQGVVVRYRARLVAQGFLQRAYDSYQPDETFSPVVHKDTLRLFLSVCAAQNLRIFQCDVKSAFLQAPLKENIFMRAPPGYGSVDVNGEEEILELSSAIYGLKQSSACFWTAVHKHLVAHGFVSILGDPCLFRKVLPDGKQILVCCYVDDLTYGVTDIATANSFLALVKERFAIDEGEGAPIDFLLGMEITQDIDKGTVHFNSELMITKLAHGVLTKEELTKSADVTYPMLVTPLQKLLIRTVPTEQFDFLSVVGSLLHIANCVRCDVALAVGILARHSATPGPQHVNAVKRVVMYLYNTRSLGITYSRISSQPNVPVIYEGARHPLDNGANILQVFADSDYASDSTRRSTMGNVIMLNGGPIAWSSILGKTVATSTCEAEVNAAVVSVKEAMHFRLMLIDLGLMSSNSSFQIAEDNSACIAQAEAGLRHVRNAKHYEIKLRFLQTAVVEQIVAFVYCPTNHQLADFFTKPLEAEKFIHFRNIIMIQPG